MQAKFVFLDLETTGLDYDKDQIIEIAMVVTDENLYPLDLFQRAIYFDPDRNLPDVVREMHTNNGLIEECGLDSSSLESAEEKALRFLTRGFTWDSDVPLGGNGVHFDREFLRRQMPMLHDFFHYRNFDVSSFKQLDKLFGFTPPESGDIHRALPDALHSAMEMRYYIGLQLDGHLYREETPDMVLGEGQTEGKLLP